MVFPFFVLFVVLVVWEILKVASRDLQNAGVFIHSFAENNFCIFNLLLWIVSTVLQGLVLCRSCYIIMQYMFFTVQLQF